MPLHRNVQQQQQTGVAASKLQDLLCNPRLSQLLQHPPAADLTARQELVIAACITALQQLGLALQNPPDAATAHHQLSAMLQQEAAHNVGKLLVWTLQRPEQLEPGETSDWQAFGAVTASVTAIWALSSLLLSSMFTAFGEANSSSSGAATLAVELTQQLRRSGKLRDAAGFEKARTLCCCSVVALSAMLLPLPFCPPAGKGSCIDWV
jgi:hypothetical protein